MAPPLYDLNGYPTVGIDGLTGPAADALQDDPTSPYYSNQVTFSKTILLNSIFNKLVAMIDILQNTAVAQANRVNFLTEWQNAYTDDMDQVHSFSTYNGDYYSDPSGQGSDPTDGNKDYNNDLMTNLNQTNAIYTTTLQNERSVVSDDAKALQTTVNQTSDAVNNQSSLATSFLQEMSTLLSTIFKSS